jgi:hypothetical protein
VSTMPMSAKISRGSHRRWRSSTSGAKQSAMGGAEHAGGGRGRGSRSRSGERDGGGEGGGGSEASWRSAFIVGNWRLEIFSHTFFLLVIILLFLLLFLRDDYTVIGILYFS